MSHAEPRWHETRLSRQGLSLPRQVSTTAHACALYPFSLETGLGSEGAFLGRDLITGGGFYFDLFTAYDNGLIQGPNAIVSGAGAHGKSAIIKSLVYRTSLLRTAGKDRFVAVIDPKGEWVPLARALGWTVLQLCPGGPVQVNPLDIGPGLLTAGTVSSHVGEEDILAQRVAVCSTLLAQALDQVTLTVSEHRLVHAALRHLGQHEYARTRSDQLLTAAPTLNDLRALLADPPSALATDLDTTPTELLERRRVLLDACAVLVDHELRGMCDGPSSTTIDWKATPGIVVDLSALLTRRKALRMVLTAAAGWLAGVMYSQPNRHKLNIIDEGWTAYEDLAIVRYLQDQWRLGRQWGVGNILITHALTDLHSQTDDGTAQSKIIDGLLNTTSVRIYLHQNPEHAGSLISSMGLSIAQADLLRQLSPLESLWQIGSHSRLVAHSLSGREWQFADTDTAMRGG
jgi:type IV secretory pathway VirB4 component